MGDEKFAEAAVVEFDPVQENYQSDGDCTVDSDHTEESLNSLLQALDTETLIPIPILEGFTNPDLQSDALKIFRTKYNSLLNRYQMATNKCKEYCEPKYKTLKNKYTNECIERKRIYNEIIEMRGNIRVFCRCRPLSPDDILKGQSNIVEFNSSHENELQIINSDNSKKSFKFDHVFCPEDNQEAVFNETLPVVMSALDGYNVCIFAYGQTGTGKTFTMEGNENNRGVNYRSLEVLFKTSSERKSDMSYEFNVSMLEVYNEKIRDLLADSNDQNSKKLEIKQSVNGTQEVPGLVESEVDSIDKVWVILKTGAKNRSVGSTSANELSSRSHCLVRVTIKGENMLTGQRSKSHMWLVDLAGSERVNKIDVEGERLKESQFINKSLSALGDVISALALKNTHIPYRNSKLTHLLQSSLGGDCKTLMFVQISPSSSDLGETICSLNFATRVRGIEQGPARKQADPGEAFKLKQIMDKLKHEEKENMRLSDNLKILNMKYESRENVFKSLQDKIRESEQTCKNYQQRIRDLENQLAEEKRSKQQNSITTLTVPKFTKPPLAPTLNRAPLAGITNRLLPPLPPSPSQKPFNNNIINNNYNNNNTSGKARRVSLNRRSLAPPKTEMNNNNNNNNNISEVNNLGKTRRVLVTPLKKRRASLATTHMERKMLELERQVSQLPRRRSINPYPVPASPRYAAPKVTPESVARFRNFIAASSKYALSPKNINNYNNSNKYNINNNLGSVRKSKLQLPSVRLVPSRMSDVSGAQQGTGSKLCFSVQKRVLIGSPCKLQKLGGLNEIRRDFSRQRESIGVGGGRAKRVLNTKRRQSII